QGDRVKGAYSLRTGLVALERVNEAGELVVLKLLQGGAFFPCADLFAGGLHGASARAMAPSSACFVPADRLTALMTANAGLGFEIAKRGCEEARENEDIIFRLCSGDLAERVLGMLESLGREAGDPAADGTLTFVLPISWRDLAGMVGTSPEVMSRLLRKMTDAGRLTVEGRTVTLSAPEGERAFG
ncbi:MAG TPA: Crp/Fnr family transcriptional regulator, partial [Candidatus Omnitrophota bacterium]|nr:Crp/Fnr family transcriptional regulator [Candidatus Omnitrophota bacterium]